MAQITKVNGKEYDFSKMNEEDIGNLYGSDINASTNGTTKVKTPPVQTNMAMGNDGKLHNMDTISQADMKKYFGTPTTSTTTTKTGGTPSYVVDGGGESGGKTFNRGGGNNGLLIKSGEGQTDEELTTPPGQGRPNPNAADNTVDNGGTTVNAWTPPPGPTSDKPNDPGIAPENNNPLADPEYMNALNRSYNKIRAEYKREADRQITQGVEAAQATLAGRGVQDSGLNTALQRRTMSNAYAQLGAQLAGVEKSQTAGAESRANMQAKVDADLRLDKEKQAVLNNDEYYKAQGYLGTLNEEELATLKEEHPHDYMTYMASNASATIDEKADQKELSLNFMNALVANSADLEGDQYTTAIDDIAKRFGLDMYTNPITGDKNPEPPSPPNPNPNPNQAFYDSSPAESGDGTLGSPYRLDDIGTDLITGGAMTPDHGVRRTSMKVMVPTSLRLMLGKDSSGKENEEYKLTSTPEYDTYWEGMVGKSISVDGKNYTIMENPVVERQVATKVVHGDDGKTWKLTMPVIRLDRNGVTSFLVMPIEYQAYDQNYDKDKDVSKISDWTVLERDETLNDL